MTRFFTFAAGALLAATLFCGTAAAEDLRGRLAVTGRIGIVNPSDNWVYRGGDKVIVSTDAGLIGGGGILYGVDDSVAFVLEISRSSCETSEWGDAEVKDLLVGAQYRLPERSHFVPYGAAGVNVLINDLQSRSVSAVDTVFGLHLAAGIDYIATRQLVLTAELRGVEAFSADVKDLTGNKAGSFDPSSLAFTVGARFFFN